MLLTITMWLKIGPNICQSTIALKWIHLWATFDCTVHGHGHNRTYYFVLLTMYYLKWNEKKSRFRISVWNFADIYSINCNWVNQIQFGPTECDTFFIKKKWNSYFIQIIKKKTAFFPEEKKFCLSHPDKTISIKEAVAYWTLLLLLLLYSIIILHDRQIMIVKWIVTIIILT